MSGWFRGWQVLIAVVVFSCISFSSIGQPTWKRVIGGYDVEQVWDVIATTDGGFVIVGSTGSFGAMASDVYMFKLDANGTHVWSQLIGGPGVEEARAIVEMNDGGFILVGSTNAGDNGGYDGLVIRTSASGEVIWQRNYGGSDWDFLHDIDLDGNGGVWVAGTTFSWGNGGDQWLLRLNADGDTLLSRRFGGISEEEGLSVSRTVDGGCVIAGSQISVMGDKDAYVVKVDATANVEWADHYGGDSLDLARDVIQTMDGGFSLMGSTKSYGPVLEQYHLKLDATGSEEWYRNWGQVNDQEGYQLLELPSGEYASIATVSQGGAGGKDMFLLRSYSDGGFLLGQTQGGDQDDLARALCRADGGYVMCGITRSYGAGQWDVFVIRTNEVGFTDSDEVLTFFDPVPVREITPENTLVYPNPSDGLFHLPVSNVYEQWRLINSIGEAVCIGRFLSGRKVNCSVPDGTYVLELTGGKSVERSKLVILNQ